MDLQHKGEMLYRIKQEDVTLLLVHIVFLVVLFVLFTKAKDKTNTCRAKYIEEEGGTISSILFAAGKCRL